MIALRFSRFLAFALVIVALVGPVPALAERRVALVMAAGAYRDIRPLANPVNDALAMRGVLEALGFEVFLETDRDLRRMRRALEDFALDAAGADVALIYFAGHGVEIGGQNLLLPVDAGGTTAAALAASALPLEDVVSVARAVAPTALIVLDACRDDPFAPQAAATGGSDGRGATSLLAEATDPAPRPGLGRMGRAEGVLFAFAAAPGETAADGSGTNSPFTAALVSYLGTEGLEVRSALTLVQQEVYDRTRGRQLPYVESGLPRLFFAAQAEADLPERERLLLAMASLTPGLRAEIEAVAARRDVPLAPLFGAAIGAGLADVALDQRTRLLDEAALAFAEVRENLRRFASDDPQVQTLRAEAEAQLSLGTFEAARETLRRAAEIDATASETLQERLIARRISEAETHLLNASAARADLRNALAAEDYRRAADLFEAVVRLAPSEAREFQYLSTLSRLTSALQATGAVAAERAAWARMADYAWPLRTRDHPDWAEYALVGVMGRAAADLHIGNYDLGISDLDRALRDYPAPDTAAAAEPGTARTLYYLLSMRVSIEATANRHDARLATLQTLAALVERAGVNASDTDFWDEAAVQVAAALADAVGSDGDKAARLEQLANLAEVELAASPADINAMERAAKAAASLAEHLAEGQDFDRAFARFEQAQSWIVDVAAPEFGDLEASITLSTIELAHARARVAAGDLPRALGLLDDATNRLVAWQLRAPDSAALAVELAETLEMRAKAHDTSGNKPQAVTDAALAWQIALDQHNRDGASTVLVQQLVSIAMTRANLVARDRPGGLRAAADLLRPVIALAEPYAIDGRLPLDTAERLAWLRGFVARNGGD